MVDHISTRVLVGGGGLALGGFMYLLANDSEQVNFCTPMLYRRPKAYMIGLLLWEKKSGQVLWTL